MFKYKYPRPALTTDALVFAFDKKQNELKLLLIQRLNEPFKDKWAFPGGFVDMDETVEQSVVRELQEETGLKNINFEQFYTASKLGRDPRGRTVSVVFWAITQINENIIGLDDAKDAKWFSVNNLPEIAFDHKEIFLLALKKIKKRLENIKNYPEFFSNSEVKQNLSEIRDFLKI